MTSSFEPENLNLKLNLFLILLPVQTTQGLNDHTVQTCIRATAVRHKQTKVHTQHLCWVWTKTPRFSEGPEPN